MAGTHILEPRRPQVEPTPEVRIEPVRFARRPAYHAYRVLQFGFVALPIIAGADKFFHLLANWDMYLASDVEKLLPVSGHTFMLVAGAIEIAAGLMVAFMPRVGPFVVAGWLCGITFNLLLTPFIDVALRDFGLALAAVALGLLAREFARPTLRKAPARP